MNVEGDPATARLRRTDLLEDTGKSRIHAPRGTIPQEVFDAQRQIEARRPCIIFELRQESLRDSEFFGELSLGQTQLAAIIE